MTTRHRFPAGHQPAQSPASVLADRLAAQVLAHEPGWRLPRVSELARRYNVSVADIRAAVAELARRHLLRQLADGHAYRSSPAEYLLTLDSLNCLGTQVDPMGGTMTSTGWQYSSQLVPENIRNALRLTDPDTVCALQSAWIIDGTTAALTSTYLPAGHRPPLLPAPGSVPGLSTILTSVPGLGSEDARRIQPAAFGLEIQVPPRWVARRLHLADGQPVATITVTFQDAASHVPAALTVATLRPDLFRITITSAAGAAHADPGASQPGLPGDAASADMPGSPHEGSPVGAGRRLLDANGVRLDLDARRAFADGTEVALARKEFDLLRILLENAGRVVTRRELLDAVWRSDYTDGNKTLETHIRRLRVKIDPDAPIPRIRTVRGIGYSFDTEASLRAGG